MLLAGLTVSARSEQLLYDSKGDNWSWSSGGDEGGGGSSYLGVDIADVSTERLAALKLKEENGAEVTMVDQDAPAGKAGLHEHDVILSLNGTEVDSAAQLRRMIKETPPGRVISLGISRDGQAMTIKVQLADRHKSMNWAPEVHVDIPRIPPLPNLPDFDAPVSVVMVHSSARSGLMVENITPQLGEFFGVKDGKGVLVRSVEKGSRGEKSGFRAGDVIVKVNSEPVHDSSDFTHALRSSAGSSAAVTVMREKREQTLTLSLPEKKDSGALIEESLEDSDWTAETVEAVNRAGAEIAAIAPVMNEVIEQTDCWKEAQEKLKEAQQELQERQEELRQEQQEREQELREQQEEQEKEMQEDQAQRQKEIEQEQQERQQELIEQQQELQNRQQELQEQLRQGMAKQLADI
jgi:membrane-associated protease RseP (regulator of RpoE activity)